MANPQTENGWIKIATEILEALMRVNLSAQESRIVMVVIRQTYGWKKKEDGISLSKFNELTGISKSHICDTSKKLMNRNILVKKKGRYSLQKDYEKWEGIKSLHSLNREEDIPQVGNKHSLNKEQKFPKQGTNIPQTGKGKTESPNKTLTNPVPKDTIKDNKETTDIMQQTCQDIADDILLLFEKNRTPTSKNISRETIDDTILTNQGEDPHIALERAKMSIKEGILNPPGYWITLMKNKSPVSMPQKEPEIEPWNQGCTFYGELVTEKVRKVAFEKFNSQWQLAVQRIVDYHNSHYKEERELTGEEEQTMLTAIKEWKDIPAKP